MGFFGKRKEELSQNISNSDESIIEKLKGSILNSSYNGPAVLLQYQDGDYEKSVNVYNDELKYYYQKRNEKNMELEHAVDKLAILEEKRKIEDIIALFHRSLLILGYSKFETDLNILINKKSKEDLLEEVKIDSAKSLAKLSEMIKKNNPLLSVACKHSEEIAEQVKTGKAPKYYNIGENQLLYTYFVVNPMLENINPIFLDGLLVAMKSDQSLNGKNNDSEIAIRHYIKDGASINGSINYTLALTTCMATYQEKELEVNLTENIVRKTA